MSTNQIIKLKPKTVIKLNPIVKENVSNQQPITGLLFEKELQPYRDKVIELLKKKTQIHENKIIPLEYEIYMKTQRTAESKYKCSRDFALFNNLYRANARHAIDNLKIDNNINNTQFIDAINNGVITLEQAVDMAPEEEHKERWNRLNEKKQNDIDESTKSKEATTDLFWCARCKRNKTTYYESQDRSSDEPMTVHITCCHCGKKWRQ